MAQVQVDIAELIRFYDESREAGDHSNAIKAVAGEELCLELAAQHLRNEHHLRVDVSRPCAPGSQTGRRLDAWFKVVDPQGEDHYWYQVEVKCWSFHGYRGGASLRIDCTGDELIRRKRDAWRSYWDPSTGFTNKTLNKVFEPMRCPERDSAVRPLACLWSAVLSSDESDQPFFSVPVRWASPSFEKVWVFSASALLRQLLSQGTKVISLDLPLTAARLKWLAAIFRAPSNRA